MCMDQYLILILSSLFLVIKGRHDCVTLKRKTKIMHTLMKKIVLLYFTTLLFIN